MFVSSYATFISASTSHKEQRGRVETPKPSFSNLTDLKNTEREEQNYILDSVKEELPLNYISQYKVLSNQQKLQKEPQSFENQRTRFSKINSNNNATAAYEENKTLFVSHRIPKITLNQTPLLNREVPQELVKVQENLLKQQMVATYAANNNYYRVTA